MYSEKNSSIRLMGEIWVKVQQNRCLAKFLEQTADFGVACLALQETKKRVVSRRFCNRNTAVFYIIGEGVGQQCLGLGHEDSSLMRV